MATCPIFTVFTATYNRAATLHRVYESLKSQTLEDFEWVIVDDGSSDGTDQMVGRWAQEASFAIVYEKFADNRGKRDAFDRGVDLASGSLLLSLDSDDACDPDALAQFLMHWHSIPEERRDQFVGVSCNVRRPDGTIDGIPFPSAPLDSDALEVRYRYGVRGEKWGFNRVDVLREIRWAQPVAGVFVPESMLWYQIALKYKTRYVNDALRIYFPTPNSLGGLPHKVMGSQNLVDYHLGMLNIDYPVPMKWRFRHNANYIRYALHSDRALTTQVREAPRFLEWLLSVPAGVMLHARDKRRLTRIDSSQTAQEQHSGSVSRPS